MTRSVRSSSPAPWAQQWSASALLLALLAFVPIDALGQAVCEAPCGINLVGLSSGVPDPHGTFRIRIGVGGSPCVPLGGIPVFLDFTSCQPDIRLCAVQPGAENVSCPIVFGTTDADGYATFTLVGGATNTTGAVPGYSGLPCDGGCMRVLIGTAVVAVLSVGAFDQDGSNGVNPADISVWLSDSFSSNYYARSDFDFTGAIAPPDLSMLLQVSLDQQSTSSCNLYCL